VAYNRLVPGTRTINIFLHFSNHSYNLYQMITGKDCPAGYKQLRLAETNCTACANGAFQNAVGQYVCNKCSPGKYTDDTTVPRESCADCPSGWKQPELGQPICETCDEGQYQDSAGQAKCKKCQTGQYEDQTGEKNSCKVCPIGFSQHLAGQQSCTACPTGYAIGITGQTDCQDCQPGQFDGGSLPRASCK
jgi:hypothetical protein